MPEIAIPQLGLVLLVGVAGSGKSTFARQHFAPFEVISSDFCRGLVSNDETDQAATPDAFDVLGYIVGTRLRRGLLTVVDATNVQRPARAALVKLAREHDVLVDAIVLDVPESLASERNVSRPDRDFGAHVVRRQARELHKSLGQMRKEGFRRVHVLRGVDEIADVDDHPRALVERPPRPDRAVRRDRRRARLRERAAHAPRGAGVGARARRPRSRGRGAPSRGEDGALRR